jgi:hypothetical protein
MAYGKKLPGSEQPTIIMRRIAFVTHCIGRSAMCYATKAAKHAFNHAQFSLYMEYWVSYP